MSTIKFSTDTFVPRDRPAVLHDVVGRNVVGADLKPLTEQNGGVRLALAMLPGPTASLSRVEVSNMDVLRTRRHASDGDASITCWLPLGASVRTDHADRRRFLSASQAMLIDHARPGQSRWHHNRIIMLNVRRAAFADDAGLRQALGVPQAANRPILRLLHAYVRSIWPETAQPDALTEAQDSNLAALVAGLAAASPEGMRRAAWPALGPARVAAMRKVIARRATEPGLSMRDVAAAVGLGPRSGHLVFEAQQLTFSEVLTEARMQRVVARLRMGDPSRIIDIALDAGFGDITHFNRLFRQRYGMTPTEMRGHR